MTTAVAEPDVTTQVAETIVPAEPKTGSFAIDVHRLSDALSLVRASSARRTTLPILGCVRLTVADGFLTMTTTDLEISMSMRIAAAGKFDACLNAVTLAKIATGQGTIHFEIASDKLVEAVIGKVRAKLEYMAPEEFPMPLDVENFTNATISRADLTDIAALRAFVSGDPTRPTIQAVKVNGAEAAATDTARLATAKLRTELPEMLIPERAVSLLEKLVPTDSIIDVVARVGETAAQFEYANLVLHTRLLEGVFPNYANVIPTEFDATIEVDSEELTGAIKSAAPAARACENRLVLIPGEGKLTVSATSLDRSLSMEYDVDAITAGTPIAQAVNVTFLMQGIRFLDTRHITIKQLDNPNKAIAMEDGGRLYVMMPQPWKD